jgi:CheY-like chemotaxis protein
VASILIAEDDKEAANGLAELLELSGHRVSVAFDGLAALKLFEVEHPDIVIADINMPELDGHSLARSLKRLPGGGTTHLIALTGKLQTTDALESKAAGFGAHLPKPVNVDKLEALIESFLGHPKST